MTTPIALELLGELEKIVGRTTHRLGCPGRHGRKCKCEVEAFPALRAAIETEAKEKSLMKAQLDKIIAMAGMDPAHFLRMTQA